MTASICLLSSGIFFPSNVHYKFTRFYKLPCSIKLERKYHYSKFYQIPRTSWNFNSIKITAIVFKSQRTFSEIMEFIKFLFKKISPTRCYFHFHNRKFSGVFNAHCEFMPFHQPSQTSIKLEKKCHRS